MVHFVSGTWNAEFNQIFIGVINQAAAVEAGTRRRATPAIRFTNLAHQFIHCRFLGFLHPDFMRLGKGGRFTGFHAVRFAPFTGGAFFCHNAGGGLRGSAGTA